MAFLVDLPRGTASTLLCLATLSLGRKSKVKSWLWLRKALWTLLPVVLGRCLLSWRRYLKAYGKHPGTADKRALCFNPSMRPSDFEERFIGKTSGLKDVYDFIVVGSGSAGCAVAARLGRMGASVLLVEAGGEAQRSDRTQRAREAFRCWQSEIDWGFRSTPQKDLLPEGRVIDLERGKTLGGSSAINYNLWVHGAAADFYRWETQYGCEGWSYKEVLPHFQALERFSEGSEASEVSSTARGKEGLIGVAPLFPPLPEVEDFMKACESHADANRIKDYNAGYLAGVSPVQLSTGGTAGGRQDCFSTLVEPLLKHYPNLQVVSETFCRKVLLESDLKARGVELELRSGEVLRISCRKEVVLSAGALLTPQLLMLSGIGEESHLKEHCIPCLLDLPAVGRNLSDHPIVPILAEMAPGQKMQGSRFHNSCGTHGVFFWQSKTGRSREARLGKSMGSDMETIFNSRIELSLYPKVMVHECGASLFNFTADYRSSIFWRWLGDLALLWARFRERWMTGDAFDRGIELMTIGNHPQSRGTVRLQSGDPHVPPVVDPKYMAEKEDVDAMIEAVRQMRGIFSAPSMAQYVHSFHPSTPSADASEAELAAYVRASCRSTWHYSCTTRMGPATKENVCDPKGRVHGVQNLRVADAGLMPEVVSGNTHAACVMIGDRIGYFIASEYS